MSISLNNKNYSLFSLETDIKVKTTINNIVQEEKNAWSKEYNAQSNSIFKHMFQEPDWTKKTELYLKIEDWLRENSANIPTWEVSGALHFGMSPDDMKESVKNKLKTEEAKHLKLLGVHSAASFLFLNPSYAKNSCHK